MNQIKGLIQFLDEKQAQEIKLLDMREVTPYMDYMIVSHFSNARLIAATAEYVTDYLDKEGIEYRSFDKNDESGWILIDAKHIIIHLFLKEQRDLYQLERLWKDTVVSDETLASL